jgi:hypothetical protein
VSSGVEDERIALPLLSDIGSDWLIVSSARVRRFSLDTRLLRPMIYFFG